MSAASLSGVDGLEVVGARTKRMVLVDGRGRLVEGIAETLRQGGIGSVHGGGSVADWWDLASRDYSRANQPDVFTHTQPDLVVLVAAGALEVDAGDTWWRSSVPHLPVVASGHRVAIGPLIRPGGPCLRCLDLHRSDRDPGWPAVLAQLSPAIPGQGPPVQADSVLTSIVAGVTAQLVHNHLDGIRPAPHGVSVELAYGELGMVARRWVPHPRCGCRAPRETMAS